MRWWRSYRLRRLERKLAVALAKWERAGRPLVVLPPLPPCDHLDTVTVPDLFHGHGMLTVCAYCSRVLEQESGRR